MSSSEDTEIDNYVYLVDRTVRIKTWKSCVNDTIAERCIYDIGQMLVIILLIMSKIYKISFEKEKVVIQYQDKLKRIAVNRIKINENEIKVKSTFDFLDCCYHIEICLNKKKKLIYDDKDLFQLGILKLEEKMFSEIKEFIHSVYFNKEEKA